MTLHVPAKVSRYNIQTIFMTLHCPQTNSDIIRYQHNILQTEAYSKIYKRNISGLVCGCLTLSGKDLRRVLMHKR